MKKRMDYFSISYLDTESHSPNRDLLDQENTK